MICLSMKQLLFGENLDLYFTPYDVYSKEVYSESVLLIQKPIIPNILD